MLKNEAFKCWLEIIKIYTKVYHVCITTFLIPTPSCGLPMLCYRGLPRVSWLGRLSCLGHPSNRSCLPCGVSDLTWSATFRTLMGFLSLGGMGLCLQACLYFYHRFITLVKFAFTVIKRLIELSPYFVIMCVSNVSGPITLVCFNVGLIILLKLNCKNFC